MAHACAAGFHTDPVQSVGVVVVHGIGEQGRFEHMDSQIRGLVQALRARPGATVTIEINGSETAAFHATQSTWTTGPGGAIRIWLREAASTVCIHVHEVWWADVNETYSVLKQVRFWFWGLAVWFYPAHSVGSVPTGGSVFPPRPGAGNNEQLIGRIQLFGVGCFFLLTSVTIGFVTILAKRLFNFSAPPLLRVFANYLSSVKLYVQRRRAGGDFLDAIGDPPRTSVRRRMIRTLADVACQNYERWYVLAHSQGAVVAFNGLMEPAFGWPGYLDKAGLDRLVAKGFAGPAAPGFQVPAQAGMVPPWPVWAVPGSVVYRRRVFSRFRGLLTYGAPIEKFAAIWPARVPVCREPGFQPGARWLNVYDPIDPVSGVMRSWPTGAPDNLPPPETFGYKAHPLLLYGHIKYLTRPAGPLYAAAPTLADGVAEWLVSDNPSLIGTGSRFFAPTSTTARNRRVAAIGWYLLAFALAALLVGLVVSLPSLARSSPIDGVLLVVRNTGLAIVVSAAITLAAGLLSRLRTDPKLNGKRQPDVPFTPIPVPYPDHYP